MLLPKKEIRIFTHSSPNPWFNPQIDSQCWVCNFENKKVDKTV